MPYDLFSYAKKKFGEIEILETVPSQYDNLVKRYETDKIMLSEFNQFPGAKYLDIDAITLLSCKPYEKRSCRGTLIFIPTDSKPTLPISFSNSKYKFSSNDSDIALIRKLLEPLDSEHALVFTLEQNKRYYAAGVIGLNAKNACLESVDFAYYRVNIINHMSWEMFFVDLGLFEYRNGLFSSVGSNNIASQKINDELSSLYKDDNIINYIELLGSLADNCKHGTSFIIFSDSDRAKNEAHRLSEYDRGVYFEESLSNLYAEVSQTIDMDGGLILSTNGMFYGYGYIFDGTIPSSIFSPNEITFSGEANKGSRHNSVRLYVYNQLSYDNKCIGIVVSEDGSCEIITRNTFK